MVTQRLLASVTGDKLPPNDARRRTTPRRSMGRDDLADHAPITDFGG